MYKYNINHQLSKVDRFITLKKLKEELLQSYGIKGITFENDRRILQGQAKSIKSDRLDAYANFFQCSVDELKNYKVQGITINDIQPHRSPNRKQFGLK